MWASVALLAEGVDRNAKETEGRVTTDVALLAEGVDRNLCGGVPPRNGWRSPSSRRAWIEILYRPKWEHTEYVALLAEGVDRNDVFALFVREVRKVALLAEGVDRNLRAPAGGDPGT